MKYLMKNFKSLLPFLLMVFALVGCDTDDLRNDVDELKNRVESLEAQVTAINENMNVLQVLVEGNKTIKSCVYDEATKTYKLVLSDDTQLELYQGEDGMANTPEITISDDNKWVINGTPTGVDATGADAALPKFKLDDQNYWMVDLDGDGTVYGYDYVYNEAGDKVQAIADDANVGGDTFFESVDYNEAEGFLEVKLTSTPGTTYKLPVVPELTCKINTENVEEYKDNVLTVGYGLSAELEVEVQGDNYFVTAPSGWTAVLGEVNPNTHKATLTVYAPKEEAAAGTLSRATADNSTDLSLQVYKGGYWAVAKIQVKAIVVISSYYDLYQGGASIKLAEGTSFEKAISVDEYGKAFLVTASESQNGIYKLGTSLPAKVLFVEPGVTIDPSGYTAGFNQIIIIGNNSSQPAAIEFSKQIVVNKEDGIFALYNMNVMFSVPNNILAQNYDGAFKNVIFDKCKILDNAQDTKNFAYISTSGRSIENLIFNDCVYELGEKVSSRPMINVSSSNSTYSNIVLNNSVFYSKKGSTFSIFAGKSATITNLQLTNNTFIYTNPGTNGMLNGVAVNTINVSKNIFYSSLPGKQSLFNPSSTSSYPTAGTCNTNVGYPFWSVATNPKDMFVGTQDITNLEEDLFDTTQGATFDLESGEFVPVSTYADYGAKLD